MRPQNASGEPYRQLGKPQSQPREPTDPRVANPCQRQGFSSWAPMTFGAVSLLQEAVLRILGYSASWVSTH